MTFKPFTTGISGLTLTDEERAFIGDERPWGYILFGRNIASPDQVADLCAALREAGGRADAPVLIDQEGGRVQRIKPPMAQKYPSAEAIAAVHGGKLDKSTRAAWLLGRLHAFDLVPLGIDMNCAPVLDIRTPETHDAIGDRSFSRDAATVTTLAGAMAEGMLAGGLVPVVKHMPGQGRAAVDSHKELPLVAAALADLETIDFAPFKTLAHLPVGMTGHVVFDALDPDNPVTTSAKAIKNVIRGHIGFDGLLLSDDMSMEALGGSYRDRTEATLAAGCDIALHCSGNLDEARGVAAACSTASPDIVARSQKALSARGKHDASDRQACRAEFIDLMGAALVA